MRECFLEFLGVVVAVEGRVDVNRQTIAPIVDFGGRRRAVADR